MNKSQGFTLIELILTMVITIILTGVLVEVMAGPIQSYFWVTRQTLIVDNAALAMENIHKDLSLALGNSIHIENTSTGQILSFKKILYKGILLPSKTSIFESLDEFPPTLMVSEQKEYFLAFPLGSQDTLYSVKLSNVNQKGQIIVIGKPLDNLSYPMPFYIVSESIRYEYTKNTHQLERIESLEQRALLGNEIQYCRFSLFNHNHEKGLKFELSVGDSHHAVNMEQPIFFPFIGEAK